MIWERQDLPTFARRIGGSRFLEEREVRVDRRDPVPSPLVECGVVAPAARGRSEVPGEDLHKRMVLPRRASSSGMAARIEPRISAHASSDGFLGEEEGVEREILYDERLDMLWAKRHL